MSYTRRTVHSMWATLAVVVGLTLPAAGKARKKVKVMLPETPKQPVTDKYHDVEVVDDYRWLEDSKNEDVRAWSDAQNAFARRALDKLPGRKALRERITALLTERSAGYFDFEVKGGKIFATKYEPAAQQPVIVVLDSVDDLSTERVLLDLNKLDPTFKTAFDWWVPSHDGRYLAVALSLNGSEDGTLYVYDVATGERLADAIPRVQYGTAGGSLAWNGDSTGFWYTRYPREGERPAEDLVFYQHVWFHKLGQKDDKDTYSLGKELPRIAENFLSASPDGKYVIDNVQNGDGGEYELYLLAKGSQKWTRVTSYADKVVEARFGPDGTLYLLSRLDAPRGKILKLDPQKPVLARATVVVPEGEGSIEDLDVSDNYLWVVTLLGGPKQLTVYDKNGQKPQVVATPPISSVSSPVVLAGDRVAYKVVSYIQPSTMYAWTPGEGDPKLTAIVQTTIADFSDAEVVRAMVPSKDGTKIPLNIIHKKGIKLNGKNPTVLVGYGGYGISMSPTFSMYARIWLDQGGVYAIANLRGGGEFGEEWHLAGNLTRKQNVFDDFAACAKWLSDARYTNPKKLAVFGGSNGGLLVGALLTQHPELVRAVVASVGIFDMLRVESQPNGEFNTTEFGTVKVEEQFNALYAYSPYHHVVDGTKYPSVLFITGANDPRVDPSHSRKMAARLQAASGKKARVLLRTDAETGHGGGKSLQKNIEEGVDQFAYLCAELGVKVKTVKKAKRKVR